MAYTWTNGELITANKLNQMGGSDNTFPVGMNEDGLDKTWTEIYDAVTSGKLVYMYWYDTGDVIGNLLFLRSIIYDSGEANPYRIYITGWDDSMGYAASSADGYPGFFD